MPLRPAPFCMNPRRIQLKWVKGWKMPANTVSVARPSRWRTLYPWWTCGGHAEAVEIFREYILRRPRLIEAAKQELRGISRRARLKIEDQLN